MNPKLKRQIQQIVPAGVIWMMFAITYILLEKGLLKDLDYYPGTHNPYRFDLGVISVGLFFVFVTGILFGFTEVQLLRRRFDHYNFVTRTAMKLFIYLLIYIFFTIGGTAIKNSINLDQPLFGPQTLKNSSIIFNNFSFLSSIPYLGLLSMISLFYLEMNNYLGHEILNNFFTGKYNKAKEEERIFMFLDMKSSTTHAEHLGHQKYFEMLAAYYADISDSVLEHMGNIYQYVGDEMVVTWSLESGLTDNNCVKAFFTMKQALVNNSESYQKKFDVVPSFKAGLHFGRVTVGEIGTIKKDLMFTGDVLNTSARIQGLCNKYAAELLISEDLREKLTPDENLVINYLDEAELRGKIKKMNIFSVQHL